MFKWQTNMRINFQIISNNKLAKNFSYLVIVEILMKILPLVTVPYIVKTIGVEKFGIITFVYVFMSYFQLLTNYAFNALATKDISKFRMNIEEYSKVFWAIMINKTLLGLFSLVLFTIIVFYIPKLHSEWIVYVFSLGMLFNQILFPIWFFQGMEEMKYIAIFTFISRLLYTISIFIFINDENDYILIPLLNSLSLILIGIVSLIFLFKRFNIVLALPSRKMLRDYFIDGWHLFVSYITNSLYTQSNIILLGTISDYVVVGIYSLATTILGAFIQVVSQFNKVIYPRLAQYADQSIKLQIESKKFLKFYIIALIIISVGIFIFSNILITLLFGSGHEQSIEILKILSVTLILSSLGGFYTRYMIIVSKQKIVLNITFKTMLVNFVLVVPFIIFFQGIGLAIAIVLVESYQVYQNVKYNPELKIKFRM